MVGNMSNTTKPQPLPCTVCARPGPYRGQRCGEHQIRRRPTYTGFADDGYAVPEGYENFYPYDLSVDELHH